MAVMTSSSHDAENLYMAIGKRIREARVKLSLTQEELAAALRMSRTSVTNIEKGRQHVLVHTLYAIASVLKIDVRQLLPGSEISSVRYNSSSPTPDGISEKEWKYIRPVIETKRGGRRSLERSSKGGTHGSTPKTH